MLQVRFASKEAQVKGLLEGSGRERDVGCWTMAHRENFGDDLNA